MKAKGPQFLNYVIPVIEVLKENGGSGNAADIFDKLVEKLNIPESEIAETLKSGVPKVRNKVQWARFYLSHAGYLITPKRGFWEVTHEGYEAKLDREKVYTLFRSIHKKFEPVKTTKEEKIAVDIDEEVVEDETHSMLLLNALRALTPKGFELICKRLLTDIGIHDISITGKPNDKGIDGRGLIKINEVVNFNVVFQCKKYQDAVSASQVRDFRGSMQGRADKGLIITTGRFTIEAKREATRDGVPAIELIDGERLVSLFETFKLGLEPTTVYRLVPEFFDNFK